jgi:hypothetical protein
MGRLQTADRTQKPFLLIFQEFTSLVAAAQRATLDVLTQEPSSCPVRRESLYVQ